MRPVAIAEQLGVNKEWIESTKKIFKLILYAE